MNMRHISGSSAVKQTIKFTSDMGRFTKVLDKSVVVQAVTNPSDQLLMRGHSNGITCLSLQGNLMLTGESGIDSDVLLWDIQEQRIIQRFSEHDNGIVAVDFSADGLFYLTYGADKLLHVVETSTGDIVCCNVITKNNIPLNLTIVKFGGRVMDPRGFKLAKYHIVAVADDGSLLRVCFIPATGQTETETIVQSSVKKFVTDIAFLASDANILLATTASGDVLVVDLFKNAIVCQLNLNGAQCQLNCIACLKQTPDQQLKSQTTRQKTVYQTYERLELLDDTIILGGVGVFAMLRGQSNRWDIVMDVRCQDNIIGIDSDVQQRIILETSQGSIKMLVPQNNYAPVELCNHHTKQVTSLHFLGDHLVTLACMDNSVRVLDLFDFMPGLVINTENRGQVAYPTAVTLNEIQLVTGFSNGDLKIYDVENGNLLLQIPAADRAQVNSISCIENYILIGGSQGDVRLWDLRSQKILEQTRPHTSSVNQVLLQKDLNNNPLSLSCSDDRYLVCQVNQMRLLDFQVSGPVRGFAQFGNLFALVCGRQILLVDLKNHQQVDILEVPQRLFCMCKSGDYLFAGCDDGSILKISVGNQKLKLIDTKQNAHGSCVQCIDALGGVVVSADTQGELIIWE